MKSKELGVSNKALSMISPKVSVIITAYNSEAFLEDALDSVSRQDFKDFELIVVDDGSDTGAASGICERFSETAGIHVQYIFQRNGGPSRARNTGLKYSKGEYVAFLDADDMYVSSKLSRQLIVFSELSARYGCVLGCALKFEDGSEGRGEKSCPSFVDGQFDLDGFLVGHLRLEGTPGYLFRRSALMAIGGFDETLWNNEDFDLIIRLNRRYQIRTHDDVVFMQRMRAGSLSNSNPVRGLNGSLRFASKVERTCPEASRAALDRKRQRAYFSAAVGELKKRKFGNYIWLVNKGLDFGGAYTWRGIFVALSGRPLRWLGTKPAGIEPEPI